VFKRGEAPLFKIFPFPGEGDTGDGVINNLQTNLLFGS